MAPAILARSARSGARPFILVYYKAAGKYLMDSNRPHRPTQMQKPLIYFACIASLLLAGCSANWFPWVYKINVQQGNVVTQNMVNKLKPGMTKRQVEFIMGAPLLVDVFQPDRWNYVYTDKPGHGKMTKQEVILFFKDNKLVSIKGGLRPQPQATGGAQTPPAGTPPPATTPAAPAAPAPSSGS